MVTILNAFIEFFLKSSIQSARLLFDYNDAKEWIR